jgi:hypothetical protein
MQSLDLRPIFQDLKVHEISAFSPWLEQRPHDFTEIASLRDAQTHRSSAISLAGLPIRRDQDGSPRLATFAVPSGYPTVEVRRNS